MGASTTVPHHGVENELLRMCPVCTVSNCLLLICDHLSDVLDISLSVALLQIDSVFDDVLARTASMAAFIFSLAGLILSVSFTLNNHQFSRRKCRNYWAKVCSFFIVNQPMMFK